MLSMVINRQLEMPIESLLIERVWHFVVRPLRIHKILSNVTNLKFARSKPIST